MRISDWSSDVCSSDLVGHRGGKADQAAAPHRQFEAAVGVLDGLGDGGLRRRRDQRRCYQADGQGASERRRLEIGFAVHLIYPQPELRSSCRRGSRARPDRSARPPGDPRWMVHIRPCRSEEHTSELQSLMRISYAVFCLKKKKHLPITTPSYSSTTFSMN